jgi:hypothetical protein|tara:strand:+ start:227 stop:526 length:300 start_codon:yes stop_codon:yes gene_type:complete
MHPTNKALLEEILNEQKRISKEMTDAINNQNLFNQRITSVLNSDSDTNQKGLVESLEDVRGRVLDLEVKNKVTAGKVAISVTILTAIGGTIWKLIGILD